ncbi:hypothetical protein [Enterobacter mori]|uniref:hypothetical protein n=1 Tax=Enterobacter mori TaxID=539813 RepID=UPI00389A18CE
MDSGFPTIGFSQAKFQVQIGGITANNGNYTWSTDQSWASVDSNGYVTFCGAVSESINLLKSKQVIAAQLTPPGIQIFSRFGDGRSRRVTKTERRTLQSAGAL